MTETATYEITYRILGTDTFRTLTVIGYDEAEKCATEIRTCDTLDLASWILAD